MQATLIEDNGNGQKIAYDSLIINNPKDFSALNSKLALKIVKSLAESPASAIDISRRLKIHEQKIYYHIRRLEKSGIIYVISNEKRHGMIAKIYSVVSPAIAAKLYDKGTEVKEMINLELDQRLLKFLSPFVSKNNLNATIVVGDTFSHGRFDKSSDEINYMIDTILFFGKFINGFSTSYCKLDVKVKVDELKNDLILIGNNKTNVVIEKINNKLKASFDEYGKESIISKISGETYTDPRIGLIIKTTNPFDERKKILLIGGIGRRGAQAASLALTKYSNILIESIKSFEDTVKVVKGFDSDGDDIIDTIKILE